MATRGLNLPTKNTFIQFPVSVGDLLEEPLRRRQRCASLNLEPTRVPEEEDDPQCNESTGTTDDHVDMPEAYEAEEQIMLPQYYDYTYSCEYQQPAPQYVYTVPMFDPQPFDTPTYTGMTYSFAQEGY